MRTPAVGSPASRGGGAAGGRELVLLAVLLVLPGAAVAQVHDAPGFQPPGPERGLGFYALSLDPADDVAALVTWRTPGTDLDLGLRGGAGDADGDAFLFGGAEVEGGLMEAGPDSPLSVAWTGGMGITTIPDRDAALVRLPLGLSLGREVATEGPSVLPYAHPRLGLDVLVGDDPPDGGDDAELNFDLDLGVDVIFEDDWRLRFGATVGRSDAVGFGVAF